MYQIHDLLVQAQAYKILDATFQPYAWHSQLLEASLLLLEFQLKALMELQAIKPSLDLYESII